MLLLSEKDKMDSYRLSHLAAKDFEHIFDYGIDNFGLVKALEYQHALKKRFNDIAAQPQLYPAVEHIRKGYRKSVFGSHSIYYKQENGVVLIMRVLGQQDLTLAFD